MSIIGCDGGITSSAPKTDFAAVRVSCHWRWLCAPVPLLVGLALCLRVLQVVFFTGSIDSEGVEYARIAENLLAGKGYVGIATPGPELMFPPLFPLLIAALTLVTHHAEIAGRLISVTMGALLVLPIYGIAQLLYGERVAEIAAVLVFCHPLLISLSALVYCEPTYFTLLMTAVYLYMRAIDTGFLRYVVIAGVAFGLAYLVRPEAIVYPILMIAPLFWRAAVGLDRLPRTMRSVGALLAGFAAISAPYIVWLSLQVGEFSVQEKGTLNFAISEQIAEGHDVGSAEYGIDADLRGRGVWMKSNLDVIHLTHFNLAQVVGVAKMNLRENLREAIQALSNCLFFGNPILFVLSIIGIFTKPWRTKICAYEYSLLCLSATPFVAALVTVSHYQLQDRYFLPLLPVMIVWGAGGLHHLSRWLRVSSLAWLRSPQAAGHLGAAGTVGAATLLLLLAYRGVTDAAPLGPFGRESRPVKIAGEWLRSVAPGAITVMASSAIPPFHAHASFLFNPETDSTTALRYIAARHVDYIVLQEKWLPPTPYARAWLSAGIPDPRARLVYRAATRKSGQILIYRWEPNS